MSFRSMVRDLRGSFGNISKWSFEVRIHHRVKSLGSSSDMQEEEPMVIQQTRWTSLPPELLRDVMKRLEEDENSWPSRKDVVSCASVCKTWRDMCKDIVRTPEFCAKLTFPVSLKQPGPRDGMIQCFIKRNRSKRTYRLYLCLTSAVVDENGKFLLAAKRSWRTSHTDYAISMDSKNISSSSNGYIGKLRSNFLRTKFIIYDTQAPYNAGRLCPQEGASRRFSSRKVSPKVPTGIYPIAQVKYELNVLGTRGPRRIQCAMHSIPASAVEPDGVVPGQPKELLPRLFEESFRNAATSFFKYSIADSSMDSSSCRFSEPLDYGDDADKESPLVLRNKVPRWHEQLQCWCLNFRGRVTVASVKNFQLIASTVPSQPAPPEPQASGSSSSSSSHDSVILQFGKVAKDMFTMDYRYPLSAFQAFAICLSSFDAKLACE